MRLLLDESVPSRFRLSLPNHEVRTVVEMGWSGIKNGELLALAANEFDAFITVDKNLPYQQNLTTLPVAVIFWMPCRMSCPRYCPWCQSWSGRFRLCSLERTHVSKVVCNSAVQRTPCRRNWAPLPGMSDNQIFTAGVRIWN